MRWCLQCPGSHVSTARFTISTLWTLGYEDGGLKIVPEALVSVTVRYLVKVAPVSSSVPSLLSPTQAWGLCVRLCLES